MLLIFFLYAQALCTFEDNIYQKISKDLYVEPVAYGMKGVSRMSHPVLGLTSPLAFYLSDKEEVALHEFFGFVSNAATVIPLKYIINRKRPENECPRWDSSFPSGHTTFIFTHAYIISHHYPSTRIPLFAFATTVGFARIYLGKHYPTDVLAGAALGLLTGLLTVKVIESSE